MELTNKAALDWNSCPADILYLVFKLLSSAGLHAVCLVNQKFRAIAERLLYSKIQFTWQKRLDYYRELESPPPITQLLWTLLSRPQLAAHIRSLHLDGFAWVVHATRFKLPKIHIPEDQLDQAVAFIRGSGVPYIDWWSQELRDGSVDALVALLLSQLQSLEYLHLSHAFTRQCALTGIVLHSTICEPGPYKLGNFQYLQVLSFLRRESRDEACDTTVKNTAAILPFFYLPNLRHVSASIQNPDNRWAWPAPHPPVPSKLKSLDLTDIREGCLGELLAVSKNLETLRWKWYYDSSVEDGFVTQTVDLDQIATALCHVQGSLTDLTITADCQPGVNEDFFPGLQTVGSLKALVNFDQIKTLQIPWAFLVGFAQDETKRLQDVIPRNIVFLTITDDLALQNSDYLEEEWPLWEWEDYAILGLLKSWLREWTRWTPHLSRITLLLSWIDTDTNQWSPRAREQLRELSAQVGIPLEFINTKHR
ncbi:hypothetical protein ATEIFO6365_0002028600 [Aspergillus terreus]|uniref:Uncharacterized protein n=1 Tax=Aspergillus terreus TaxID=33178 RepID=A0A5M3YUD4_ASPTE|nr:hypothetical protein ATETN484_0004028600 [Aspergillus terreus]GFF13176.1 hypothetical protein ATEIFO6365_0002028600 [Aspergillus terreus]